MVSSRSVRGSLTPFLDGSEPSSTVTQSNASAIDLPVSSMMLMPPTVTASDSGLSLLPLHDAQGSEVIYRSISSLV